MHLSHLIQALYHFSFTTVASHLHQMLISCGYFDMQYHRVAWQPPGNRIKIHLCSRAGHGM